MAFNKQQQLGIGLITIGVVLSVTAACFANSNDKKYQEEDIKALEENKRLYGNGGMVKTNTIVSINQETGKVIKETHLPTSSQTSTYPMQQGNVGPAGNQQPMDINDRMVQQSRESANASAKFHQYQQNQPVTYQSTQPNYPQQTLHSSNQINTAIASCEFNQEAGSVGIKHFRFPEANNADLVTIGGRHQLHREAVDSLRRMQADAKASGASLEVGSAFRSVSYQQGIINRKKSSGLSLHKIYHMSAPAGFSEHHTGFAVDFTPINSGFAKTKGFAWLQKNANKYGWYQTFTPSYAQKSGVSEESWHWKYLGSATAQQMLANGNCL